MKLPVPDIPESERSPLALILLDIVSRQQRQIARLEGEIARLKGLRPRPTTPPSTLEAPPLKPPDPGRKRPGPGKRRKNAQLTIHREVLVPLPSPPPGATRKGYEDFIVQDLVFGARNARYRRGRWQLPGGRALLAPRPAMSPRAATSAPPPAPSSCISTTAGAPPGRCCRRSCVRWASTSRPGNSAACRPRAESPSTRRRRSCCRRGWRCRPTSAPATRGHVRIATEGALLGSPIAHGVSPELVTLSDGGAVRRVSACLLPAACRAAAGPHGALRRGTPAGH